MYSRQLARLMSYTVTSISRRFESVYFPCLYIWLESLQLPYPSFPLKSHPSLSMPTQAIDSTFGSALIGLLLGAVYACNSSVPAL